MTPALRVPALLAAVLLTVSCSGAEDAPPAAEPTSSVSSPTAEPTRAKPAPRPRTGACYRLTYDEALAPTSSREPVRCDRAHTSQTFAVGALDLVTDGHLLAVDSARVERQVSTTCPRRLPAFLGGSLEDRRLSTLRAVWFTPSVEESDQGADWFRCDVISLAADEELARLEGPVAGVLDTETGRDRYGICGTTEPGRDGFRRVVCSREHAWRAVRTVPFRPGPYPGQARVRAAGDGPCEAAGRAAADDALSFAWGYEWPTREQWRSGQTYGTCWAPD